MKHSSLLVLVLAFVLAIAAPARAQMAVGGGGLANITVTANQGTSPWIVGTSETVGTGTITTNGASVDFSTAGCAAVLIDLAGSVQNASSPLFKLRASVNGRLALDDLKGHYLAATTGKPVPYATMDGLGQYLFDCAGYSSVRVIMLGGSGTINVTVTFVGLKTSPRIVDVASASLDQLPAALVGGRLDQNLGAWLGSTAPSVGSKTSANSVPVVIASDQGAVPSSQSGTWTVQQGATGSGAASPWGVRLSDGSAFYDGTKTGQLPSALGARSAATSLSVVPNTDTAFPASQSGTWTVQQGSTGSGAASPWGVRFSDGSAFYDGTKTGQLPSALGARSGAISLSVVPNTDTAFPSSQSGTWTVQQGATGSGAASPWGVRFSDGSAFYDGAKTGQLPSALGARSAATSLSVVPNTDTAFPSSQSGTWTVQQGSTSSGAGSPWAVRLSDGSAFVATSTNPAYSAQGASAKVTYRADFSGVVGGGSGNLIELTSSGAKVVKILAVHFAKPSTQVTLIMRRQSTNSSGGSSTTVTNYQGDTGDASAQAVVKQYTAAPTPGSLVAVAYTNVIATTDTLLEEFGPRSGEPCVIRSGQSFALSVSAATTPNGYIEWTEE
jgi:hypothetical protein